MTLQGNTNLDQLCQEDTVIRQLIRTMRDGRGMRLDEAVTELSEIVPAARVEVAADRVRELIRDVQTARTPRAVVAGNIESWYAGPRTDDRNWSSLVGILREDGWTDHALTALDESSTKVVAHLPNPHGPDDYQSKGLVLGYVQSGKTTNFTAVIAKAADAGYRIFIVLSGVHKGLRRQTEHRLAQQLSGPQSHLWYTLTTDEGFHESANVDALASAVDQRSLAVVLKNPFWLRRLKRWFEGARPEVLAQCPVLVIDDEADQASVNTAKPDRQPTSINRLIRQTLAAVPKTAYVGYTATPFANVLIDPREYQDLYPRDFIVDLPRPEMYIGPEAIFGREPLQFDAEDVEDDGHDFVRSVPIEEIDGLRPKGRAKRHDFEPEITDSLDDALRYFLLSTAARRLRGRGNRHATALIHTSQHVDVHQRTAEEIERHLRSVAGRLARRETALLESLESMWREESERVPADDFGLEPISWDNVAAMLPVVAESVEVITDNSKSDARLDFDEENPRVIVAVGGNTLSRGLTLEGLAVSFFVRTASAYDTLLQMGRWFGYRNGYADLTRIWMTDEMRGWFHHLATVEQEIRYDIERYETHHVTPDQLGVRIRTHPKLAITAAAKMRQARREDASYSGRRIQTILFNHRDAGWLDRNIDAGRALLTAVSDAPRREVRPGITVVGPVQSTHILDFLERYSFHENSRDLDSKLIARYIMGRRAEGELSHFHLAVMGKSPPDNGLGALALGLDHPVGCINRARINVIGGATYADIKSLMSASDRVVDLAIAPTELQEMAMGKITRLRNLPIHGGRGDGTGLLLLYPVSKNSVSVRATAKTREPLDAVSHVLGVGLVFPESRSSTAVVDYMTADIASMKGIDVESPDEDDDLDEREAAAA